MQTMTGRQLSAAIIAGANALNRNKAMLDAMNVFPVPDGDTGINMYLTALSAAAEADKAYKTANENGVGHVAKAASAGALRGARGNSGVILSQIFRGFAKGFEGLEEATALDFAKAFDLARETAVKAVMKPKEGTILTISREAAEKAADMANSGADIDELLAGVIRHCTGALRETTNMLPELKAAGVEDAGGKGLLVLLEGMYDFLTGAAAEKEDDELTPFQTDAASETGIFSGFSNETRQKTYISPEDIPFAYCTELFITTPGDSEIYEAELTLFLDELGDSVVVVSDYNLLKIHVHTNNPGIVLEKALEYGPIDSVKIDNMRNQGAPDKISWLNTGTFQKAASPPSFKDTGFVAVANGKGFIDIFTSLGADYVVKGGQSLNPSADEIIRAISAVPAESVIILPNNKNIVETARQAASLCKEKKVYVVPTRSMPQGLAALTGYVHSSGAEENAALMENLAQNIHTGLLTKAHRDTTLGDTPISKGSPICIIDGKVAPSGKNISDAARSLLKNLITDNISFVTIYYGQGEKRREAEKLLAHAKKEFPLVEFELQNGGQPLYNYIVSAE